MLFVTEIGKEVKFYNTIIGDDESLMGGYGYVYPKKRNNQEIHSDRGNHQVNNFVPKFIKGDLFDAEEDAHYLGLEPVASVQKVKLVLSEDQKSEVCFTKILCCLQPQRNPFIFSTRNLKSPILIIEKRMVSLNVSINSFRESFKVEEQFPFILLTQMGEKRLLNMQVFRSLIDPVQNNYVELNASQVAKMSFVTESGKEVEFYNTIIGDDESLMGGCGYIYLKKRNNQEIHSDRGNHQVYYFVPKFIKGDLFDAEEDTHCLGLEPVASVQRVKLILGENQKSGVCFMIVLCLQPRKNPFIFNTGNLKSSILNIEKKTISFSVSTNNASREVICRSDCSHNVVNFIILDIDLKVMFILVMIFVSAGGKMVQRYKMFIGSDATFKGGYGYIYSKKVNNQGIHQEGKDRRVLFFVIISFVSEENLEAEVCIHQVQHILKFLVTEIGVIYCVCKSSGNLIKRSEFLLFLGCSICCL
jgi:hypothetical protein